MSDRPIIFSAPMIHALLDGRKTQTRRVLRPQPSARPELHEPMSDEDAYWAVFDGDEIAHRVQVPYAPGDRLWVREGHAMVPATAYRMSEGVAQNADPKDCDRACIYREGWDRSNGGFRWRSPIHMPRWASRLTLTVTDVRVQRLQEISEDDARTEGFGSLITTVDKLGPSITARDGFRDIWNSIHGPDAWDANPWVAAISFTVHRCNIDTMEEGTW